MIRKTWPETQTGPLRRKGREIKKRKAEALPELNIQQLIKLKT